MNQSKQAVFRKVALERLSSPEQLDQLVTITDPRGWIIFSVLSLLFLSILIWAFFGIVPTNIRAPGILITQGGTINDAMVATSGVIENITVNVEDMVSKGQVVATIRQSAIEQQLEHQRQALKEQEVSLAELNESFSKEKTLKQKYYERRRESIEKVITATQEREEYLARTIGSLENNKNVYISAQQIEEMRADLSKIRQDISVSKNELLSVDEDELQFTIEGERSIRNMEQIVNKARREFNAIQLQMDQDYKVIAPIDGRVNEIKMAEGTVVQSGQPVLSIESRGEGMQALTFISTSHGKKVRKGMQARIEPITIRKEEFGTILGYLEEVSEFPVTRQGMSALLHNDTLVDSFFSQGAPYSARVNLNSANTESGLQWSSGTGPPDKISTGTMVQVEITIRQQRPITMAIPALKRLVGVN